MALVVNSNPTAMNALGNLNRTNRGLTDTFSNISSGLRINNAADDSAGLAVAENLEAEQMSLRQAQRNTNDGISVIQTAEGATNEVSDILKRMRELAVQSSSETLHNNERSYIQDEFQQLSDEVDRISHVTEFNGIALANGAAGLTGSNQMNVQVGIHNSSDDRIAIALGDLRASTLGVADSGGTGEISLNTVGSAQAAITQLDAAIDTVNKYRSQYGSVQNRLESALNNLEVYTENVASSESRIRDADFAHETAEMSKFQVMQQAGVAILGQANGLSQGALRLI
jgi:flagellin